MDGTDSMRDSPGAGLVSLLLGAILASACGSPCDDLDCNKCPNLIDAGLCVIEVRADQSGSCQAFLDEFGCHE